MTEAARQWWKHHRSITTIIWQKPESRPKPKSGVDDVDHIYERLQERKKEREEREQEKNKQPFLEGGE